MKYLEDTNKWIDALTDIYFNKYSDLKEEVKRLSKKIVKEEFLSKKRKILGKIRYSPRPKTIAIVLLIIVLENKKISYDIDEISYDIDIDKRTINAWKRIFLEVL